MSCMTINCQCKASTIFLRNVCNDSPSDLKTLWPECPCLCLLTRLCMEKNVMPVVGVCRASGEGLSPNIQPRGHHQHE